VTRGRGEDDLPRSIASLRQLWIDNPCAPENYTLWRRMHAIKGRTAVVLGAGVKELAFIDLAPERIVFSGPRLDALRSFCPVDASFEAIDPLALPFADDSVDVLYGWELVSGLPSVDGLVREALRVLRAGGQAVFMDRPSPRGPQREVVERLIRAVGGIPWFETSSFLLHRVLGASESLRALHPRLSLTSRSWVQQTDPDLPYAVEWHNHAILVRLHRLDLALARRFAVVRRKHVRLAWGWEMPLGVVDDP
jgi:SAM-dependent methyltransferase